MPLQSSFFAMTQHIHRFQRLGHGHVQGHYSAYHSNQQPESSCQLIHFVFCPEKNLSKAQLAQINSSSFCCSLAPMLFSISRRQFMWDVTPPKLVTVGYFITSSATSLKGKASQKSNNAVFCNNHINCPPWQWRGMTTQKSIGPRWSHDIIWQTVYLQWWLHLHTPLYSPRILDLLFGFLNLLVAFFFSFFLYLK